MFTAWVDGSIPSGYPIYFSLSANLLPFVYGNRVMSMSALVQVAAITGALVQVAAIISALVQFGCYHWCSSTVGYYHQCSSTGGCYHS